MICGAIAVSAGHEAVAGAVDRAKAERQGGIVDRRVRLALENLGQNEVEIIGASDSNGR
jgi:hypothetical protein